MIIFDYFITEYICLNGLFITFIIFNDSISKDIFGDTVIENNCGNRKTIKKDIFGDTVIEDNRGNRKSIKKDIFGNTVIISLLLLILYKKCF